MGRVERLRNAPMSETPAAEGVQAGNVTSPLLTLREAAKYLRVGCTTVKHLRSRGAIPGTNIVRRTLFLKSALDAYLLAHTGTTEKRKGGPRCTQRASTK